MAGQIGPLISRVLGFQRRGIADPSDEFDVMPEFMAQDAPQDLAGFRFVRLRVKPVKRALEHHDLPHAVTDLILPQRTEIASLRIVRDRQGL